MAALDFVHIDPESGVPPYRQLLLALREAAHAGQLPAGTRLPAVRRLAEDLGLAANTVARAYRELEQSGVLVTRGRHGTVVAQPGGRAELTSNALHQAALRYVEAAEKRGAAPDDILAAVQRVLNLR